MHYLENFRILIKLYKALENAATLNYIKSSVQYDYIHMKWKFHDNTLTVSNNTYNFEITNKIDINVNNNNSYYDKNYISLNSKRVYCMNKKSIFHTFLNEGVTVLTSDLITEEGYFQHLLLSDIKCDLEEIQQVYTGVLECCNNGLLYKGSYRGGLLNPIPFIRRIVLKENYYDYWVDLYPTI